MQRCVLFAGPGWFSHFDNNAILCRSHAVDGPAPSLIVSENEYALVHSCCDDGISTLDPRIGSGQSSPGSHILSIGLLLSLEWNMAHLSLTMHHPPMQLCGVSFVIGCMAA